MLTMKRKINTKVRILITHAFIINHIYTSFIVLAGRLFWYILKNLLLTPGTKKTFTELEARETVKIYENYYGNNKLRL